MGSQKKELLVNIDDTDQCPNMLDWNFRKQSGLETIALGFESHLQGILIETVGERLLLHGRRPGLVESK